MTILNGCFFKIFLDGMPLVFSFTILIIYFIVGFNSLSFLRSTLYYLVKKKENEGTQGRVEMIITKIVWLIDYLLSNETGLLIFKTQSLLLLELTTEYSGYFGNGIKNEEMFHLSIVACLAYIITYLINMKLQSFIEKKDESSGIPSHRLITKLLQFMHG